MDHTSLFELITVFLGGSVAILRFWPQLREAAIFFQIALFLTQLFGFYMKKNQGQKKRVKDFMYQLINHYLETHPQGREIAKTTNIDERVQKLINTNEQKEDLNTHFHRLFLIEIDSEVDKQ